MKLSPHIAVLLVLIYLFPALVDLAVSVIGFVSPIRLAKMGCRATTVAGAGALWSLVYTVVCLRVSRSLTARNSAPAVLTACVLLAAICGLFPVFPGIPGIYALSALGAAATALFFPSFQVFMKAADGALDKPLACSTGLYTFAWSAGFAIAPFVSGFFMELGHATAGRETSGWKYCYAFAGVCAAAAAVGFHWVERFKRRRGLAFHDRARPACAPRPDCRNGATLPDLAWLGWIGAGAGVIALSMVRNVFPARAVVALHLSDSRQGMISFLLYAALALTGLALIPRRAWMYSPSAVAVSGAIGLAAAICFGCLRSTPALCAAAVLFGVYAGFFFFYLVFHALCHPVKAARYVGINEAVVGIGGLIGPLMGGMLADRVGHPGAFLSAGLVILAATAVQIVVMTFPRSPSQFIPARHTQRTPRRLRRGAAKPV